MNPLVGPALSSRTSMHCLNAPEPKMKKLRLSGSFHSDESPTIKNTPTPLHSEVKPLAVSSGNAATKEPPAQSPTPSAQPAAAAPASTAKPTVVASSPPVAPVKPAAAEMPARSENPKRNGGEQAVPAGSKVTLFSHLKQKYYDELSYMLREFEKLERQLLGARKTEENAGSRERREKLHSFIIHLQDTITQIETGVQQETSGAKGAEMDPSKLAETVQKLEEHILANLLPVKVRLKKQLAAQQGARHNPVGMPHRGWNQQPKDDTKGTFAAAAEKKRKLAEEAGFEARAAATPVEPHQTQFGKPIANGGSSLTKKLHGQTLGNSVTKEPPNKDEKESKRYYGGMALGSDQIESSVTAASSVHKLIIKDTEMLLHTAKAGQKEESKQQVVHPGTQEPASSAETPETLPKPVVEDQKESIDPKSDPQDLEQRRRRRKRRRKRMLREQERKGSMPSEAEVIKARDKKLRQAKKQRGPRQVEYMCALCNETYSGTCEFNPWWALTQHDCPKCRKTQIPKVDISAPANAIEYHPALLAHADDNIASALNNAPPPLPPVVDMVVSTTTEEMPDDHISLGSDVSSGLEDVSTDGEDSLDVESDGDESVSLSPADRAENENFGAQYDGPKLEDKDASRLLLLMSHASTCSGQHKSEEHRDVCRSTQWMMLHVRDCAGTTSGDDICPFPWCRKVKHLLYHLVSCVDWENCHICSNPDVNNNMRALMGLNKHRFCCYRERLFSSKPEERAAALVVQTAKPAKSVADANTGREKSQKVSVEFKEDDKTTSAQASPQAVKEEVVLPASGATAATLPVQSTATSCSTVQSVAIPLPSDQATAVAVQTAVQPVSILPASNQVSVVALQTSPMVPKVSIPTSDQAASLAAEPIKATTQPMPIQLVSERATGVATIAVKAAQTSLPLPIPPSSDQASTANVKATAQLAPIPLVTGEATALPVKTAAQATSISPLPGVSTVATTGAALKTETVNVSQPAAVANSAALQSLPANTEIKDETGVAVKTETVSSTDVSLSTVANPATLQPLPANAEIKVETPQESK